MAKVAEDFYLRYYVGHKGKFGHEFLEFEFRPDGKLRYANNSNYKNDTMIRKEAYVHHTVMEELKRVIVDSEIMAEDDTAWPPPDRVGRQVSKTIHSFCAKFADCFCLVMLTAFCFGCFSFIFLRESFQCRIGAGNCDWGRAHFIYYIENRLSSGCKSIERPRRITWLLLFGARFEMLGVLINRSTLQNQAYLNSKVHIQRPSNGYTIRISVTHHQKEDADALRYFAFHCNMRRRHFVL